jgi:hypothetical protein
MACNLYSVILPPSSTNQYNILDCSGNTQSKLYLPFGGGEIKFCANEIVEFTGATPSVTSGACQSNCACFTTNLLTNESNLTNLTYVDCNNNYYVDKGPAFAPDKQILNAQPGEFFDFCALYVSVNTRGWSVTNNGDCETGCTFCRCIIVSNTTSELTENFTYTDCNGSPNLVTLNPKETITFCGLDTDITVAQSTNNLAVNYGNQCVDDPGADYPFKCPCKCTTFSNDTQAYNDDVYLLYTDCDNNTNTIQPNISTKFETITCVQNFVSIIPGIPNDRPEPNAWSATYQSDCTDGSCPCYCYSIFNDGPEFSLGYVDCGATGTTIHTIYNSFFGINTSFCSPSIITQQDITELSTNSKLYTGNTCSSGSCVCNCYSLTNNNGFRTQPKYIDCNGNLQTISLEDGETQKVCSIGLSYSDTENIDIINEGPCIDGECPSTPITGDCTCYYVISTNGLETIDVSIVDCDNIPNVLTLTEGKGFCAKSYISASEVGSLIGRSNGLCTGGECPQNVNCYNIDAGGSSDVQTYYIDPEGIVSLISEPGPVSFCAKVVLTEYDSTGNPVGNELGTVTNTGDCIFNETEGLYNCPAPCYCLYSFNSTFVDYINCNYESVTLSLSPGFNKICAQSVISSDGTFFDSGLLCDNNRCPNYCCNCYTITNLGSRPFIGFTYLTCDLTMSEPYDIPASESLTVCALNVPPDANGGAARYSVTLNGPCYNGQCVDTMSIQDQLLYDILTTYGPCPDICCGKNEGFGGPVGIDINDIKSGKVL